MIVGGRKRGRGRGSCATPTRSFDLHTELVLSYGQREGSSTKNGSLAEKLPGVICGLMRRVDLESEYLTSPQDQPHA